MVLDTSALIAVLLAEPERDAFADTIAEAPVRLVSSVSVFECSIVLLARKGPSGLLELDRLLAAADVEIADFRVDTRPGSTSATAAPTPSP